MFRAKKFTMSHHYSIDVYRTDDAILIHDKPGGWKRGILGLLLALIGVIFIVPCFIFGILFGPPRENGTLHIALMVLGLPFGFMVFSFVYVFFFSLWRIGGHAF